MNDPQNAPVRAVSSDEEWAALVQAHAVDHDLEPEQIMEAAASGTLLGHRLDLDHPAIGEHDDGFVLVTADGWTASFFVLGFAWTSGL